MPYTLFRFRRDLRRDDNRWLWHALQGDHAVIPLFIFDTTITDALPADDHRVSLLYDTLSNMDDHIRQQWSSLLICQGSPVDIFTQLLDEYDIDTVITCHDYEPDATRRDEQIRQLCHERGVVCETYQDQVIFEKDDILTKSSSAPYKVFTPYKRQRLAHYDPNDHQPVDSADRLDRLRTEQVAFPSREELWQVESPKKIIPYTFDHIMDYETVRDDPAADQTTYLSPYLRFWLVSVRRLAARSYRQKHDTFLSELVWREFFMQVLRHRPHTVDHAFQQDFEDVPRRDDDADFRAWQEGRTGYPIVDAGMRQLAQTGYMHNRIRMIVASFLTKHLLIHRKRGERHFARELFDYELSSNVGNRQRAASTGVDASPYFRVFNPWTQQSKFDPDYEYIRRRIPDFDPETYTDPIVEHKMARERAIRVFKQTKEQRTP